MSDTSYIEGERHSGREDPWGEGAEFMVTGGTCVLRLFLANTTKSEEEDVRSGGIDFGLLHMERDTESALYLLFKIGQTMGWSDASFNWHRVLKDRLPRIDIADEWALPRWPLIIVLVDANTDIVRAVRNVEIPERASRIIYWVLRHQRDMRYYEKKYDQFIDDVMMRYTAVELIKTSDTKWMVGKK